MKSVILGYGQKIGRRRIGFAMPLSRSLRPSLVAILSGLLFSLTSCDRTKAPVVTRLTKANVDQVQAGMTQAQVQSVLGAPSDIQTKDFVIYKKTTFRYKEGAAFVNITFKNDELDSKQTNIGTRTD